MKSNIHTERIQQLNEAELKDGSYVLYWMQQSQRAEWNQALEFAIERANELDQGVVVVFGLMDDYPEANERHYAFMLEGLQEVKEQLADRGIQFILEKGHPAEVSLRFSEKASLLVCDRGYLRHQREWRSQVAGSADCPVYQIECDAIVPVEVVSDKEEYAARTIRPKLHEHLDEFVVEVTAQSPAKDSRYIASLPEGEDLSDIPSLLRSMDLDRSVAPVEEFKGGTSNAKQRFRKFVEQSLKQYDDHRNQPQTEHVSHMSKYLHFGQISPLWLLDQVKDKEGENRDAFIEELLVRRELAINFCFYNEDYDKFDCLPDWALETLAEHKSDERPDIYTKEELENAQTDDPYWNAAMRTMKEKGYLHNHMRMYWGKQILLYTNTPQYAHKVALELNNKYFLDGRDCNSFANVAWLFGKHDRAWQEREVWGKVRPMTKGGLERKIDTEAYLEKVEEMLGDNG